MMQQQMMQQQIMQQQMLQQQMMQQQMMQQQMMQQQMRNKKMMEILEKSENPQENYLNIIFKVRGKRDDSLQYNIQVLSNEMVSSLIQKYRNKSGDFGKKKKFIFNAKALVPSLTCAESGLSDNSIVQVIDTKDIEGALNKIN